MIGYFRSGDPVVPISLHQEAGQNPPETAIPEEPLHMSIAAIKTILGFHLKKKKKKKFKQF